MGYGGWDGGFDDVDDVDAVDDEHASADACSKTTQRNTGKLCRFIVYGSGSSRCRVFPFMSFLSLLSISVTLVFPPLI